MILLLLQFRITVWQLKEVAIGRNATMASASSASARRTAVSYTDEMSKVSWIFVYLVFWILWCEFEKGTTDTKESSKPLSMAKEEVIETGVINL